MAVVDDGNLDLRDRWPAPGSGGRRDARRGGRPDPLLVHAARRAGSWPRSASASSSCRSSTEPTRPPPTRCRSRPACSTRSGSQLDIAPRYSPPSLAVFENRAAIPTTARLDGELAEASRVGSPDELVAVDTSGGRAGDGRRRRVPPRRRLGGGGGRSTSACRSTSRGSSAPTVRPSPVRVGFGVTTAYDVTAAGTAELRYRSPASRTTWLLVLGGLWVAALVASSRVRIPARLRPVRPGRRDADRPRHRGPARRPLTARTSRSSTPTTESDLGWVEELLTDEEAQVIKHEEIAAVNWRRLPILVLFVARSGRRSSSSAARPSTPTPPVFSTISAPWMPAVPVPGGLTSSWFCPGVPASGDGRHRWGGRDRQRRRISARRPGHAARRTGRGRRASGHRAAAPAHGRRRRRRPHRRLRQRDGRDRRRRRARGTDGRPSRGHVGGRVRQRARTVVVPRRGVHGRGQPWSSSS